MGRKPRRKPSFYKIIIKDDFPHLLRLPPAFVDEHGKHLRGNVKLRTKFEDIYVVKVEQIEEEDCCCFTQGWDKFALDFGLKIGEFLVFWYDIGKSTFDVSVFGIKGCERRIKGTNDVESENDMMTQMINHNNSSESMALIDGGPDESDNHVEEVEEANPQFKIVMKEYHKRRVLIPKEFAVVAGLTSARAVVLKYAPKQRHWPVLLDHNLYISRFRLQLSLGWKEFQMENGLKMGKSYLFEYIRDTSVIQVKLFNGRD